MVYREKTYPKIEKVENLDPIDDRQEVPERTEGPVHLHFAHAGAFADPCGSLRVFADSCGPLKIMCFFMNTPYKMWFIEQKFTKK